MDCRSQGNTGVPTRAGFVGRGPRWLALALLSGQLALAQAQAPMPNYMELQSRLEAAQAAAVRLGDAALTCDQLERELVANAQAPEMQSFVSSAGAAAQQKQDAMNAAAGKTAAQAALSVFSSVVPGGAMIGMPIMAAGATAQGVDAARNLQQNIQQMQDTMSVLPQLMRGQRVIELAQARKCEWLQ